MHKITIGFILCGALISGCSSNAVVSNTEYQKAQASSVVIEPLENSVPVQNKMPIPNEAIVANIEPKDTFIIPRAPSIFQSLRQVGYQEMPDKLVLTAPASLSLTRNVVNNFLISSYGEGSAIRSNGNTRIETEGIEEKKQGKLASMWSKITRLYPDKQVFEFIFNEQNDQTQIEIRFRTEKQGEEPTDWLSPLDSKFTHTFAVRLWGALGRQLNESSTYLSNLKPSTETAIWIDHNGQFSLNLAGDSAKPIRKLLNDAGLFLISESPLTLALKPASEIPKVGDLKEVFVPMNGGKTQMKLFNVRRRNLNDVDWQEREYPFEIQTNSLGRFLVVDFSAIEYPELRSFLLMQRFLSK